MADTTGGEIPELKKKPPKNGPKPTSKSTPSKESKESKETKERNKKIAKTLGAKDFGKVKNETWAEQLIATALGPLRLITDPFKEVGLDPARLINFIGRKRQKETEETAKDETEEKADTGTPAPKKPRKTRSDKGIKRNVGNRLNRPVVSLPAGVSRGRWAKGLGAGIGQGSGIGGKIDGKKLGKELYFYGDKTRFTEGNILGYGVFGKMADYIGQKLEDKNKPTQKGGMGDFLKGLFAGGIPGAVGKTGDFLKLIGTKIKELFVGIFGAISGLFKKIPPGLLKGLKIGGGVLSIGLALIDGIVGIFKAKEWKVSGTSGLIAGILGGLDKGLLGAFIGAGKWAAIGAMVGSIVPGVGTLIGGIIGGAFGAIIGWIGGENIAKVINPIVNFFSEKINSIKDILLAPFKKIWSKLSPASIGKKLGKTVGQIILTPIDLLGKMLQFVNKTMVNIGNKVVGFFKNTGKFKDQLLNFFGNLLNKFVDGFKNFNVKEILKSINISEFNKKIGESVSNFMKNGFLTQAISFITDFFKGMFEQVSSYFSDMIDYISVKGKSGIVNISGFGGESGIADYNKFREKKQAKRDQADIELNYGKKFTSPEEAKIYDFQKKVAIIKAAKEAQIAANIAEERRRKQEQQAKDKQTKADQTLDAIKKNTEDTAKNTDKTAMFTQRGLTEAEEKNYFSYTLPLEI